MTTEYQNQRLHEAEEFIRQAIVAVHAAKIGTNSAEHWINQARDLMQGTTVLLRTGAQTL